MAQYVDKTKIEDILRNLWKEDDGSNPEHRICYNKALQEVQYEIDTLEVKEVDLEKEVTSQIRLLSGVHSFHDGKQWWKGTYNELSYFAKHFFELGLKSQSNITLSNIDDVIRENGLDPDSKEAKVFKEAYSVAIDRSFEKFKKGE